ncbi:MAG: MerR family DNA-binding transcriptional regulator [Candidatus Babeliales bacterium]
MHIKEAASFVGVTPNTLRNWEREQKLRTYRNPLNHYRLYDKTDLELLLKNIKTRSL